LSLALSSWKSSHTSDTSHTLLQRIQHTQSKSEPTMCLSVSPVCLLSLLLLCLVLPAFNGHAAAATRARVSSSTTMTRNIEEENGKLTHFPTPFYIINLKILL